MGILSSEVSLFWRMTKKTVHDDNSELLKVSQMYYNIYFKEGSKIVSIIIIIIYKFSVCK